MHLPLPRSVGREESPQLPPSPPEPVVDGLAAEAVCSREDCCRLAKEVPSIDQVAVKGRQQAESGLQAPALFRLCQRVAWMRCRGRDGIANERRRLHLCLPDQLTTPFQSRVLGQHQQPGAEGRPSRVKSLSLTPGRVEGITGAFLDILRRTGAGQDAAAECVDRCQVRVHQGRQRGGIAAAQAGQKIVIGHGVLTTLST